MSWGEKKETREETLEIKLKQSYVMQPLEKKEEIKIKETVERTERERREKKNRNKRKQWNGGVSCRCEK